SDRTSFAREPKRCSFRLELFDGTGRSPNALAQRGVTTAGRHLSARVHAGAVVIRHGKTSNGEVGMRMQRNFLLFIALTAAVATPALGQTATSGGPACGATKTATPIPDFSRG